MTRPLALPIGVVDLVAKGEGRPSARSVAESVDLAIAVEELGYHRFWIGEHHDPAGYACGSPEVLTGIIAARTKTIRVGTGALLLNLCDPRRVYESFEVLSGVFPGRIDLGLGRSQGDDRVDGGVPAAAGSVGSADYAAKVSDLKARCKTNIGHLPPNGLQLWMLGAGLTSAALAGSLKLPFCFAHFFNPSKAAEAIALYRNTFRACTHELGLPRVAMCVSVLCSGTLSDARLLATSHLMWLARDRPGVAAPVPPPDPSFLSRLPQQEELLAPPSRMLVGEARDVARSLSSMSAQHELDEMLLTSVCFDAKARLESYELLANELQLMPSIPARVFVP